MNVDAAQREPVVIIGGGIIGLCAAYYLRRGGAEVLVVEKAPDSTAGASAGNNGMVVPSHFIPLAAPGMVTRGLKMLTNRRSPFFIRPKADLGLAAWCLRFIRSCTEAHVEKCAPVLRDLSLESRRLFIELAAGGLDNFDFQSRGLFMFCRSRHGLDEEAEVAAKARALGLDVAVLDREGVKALEPELEFAGVGAVHFREDCQLSPDRFLAALRRWLTANGVEIRFETEVTGFTGDNRRITGVELGREIVPARAVVLAAGSWSAKVGNRLGLGLSIQPGKGYSMTLEKPPVLPRHCGILAEAKVAVTPMGERLRFGGTMEVGGKPGVVDRLRLSGITGSVADYLPQFPAATFEGVPVWDGLRPCSPDGMPYLGATRRWDNLFVGTGHAMMGLSLGPVSGRVLADLVEGRNPSLALAGCEVDR